MDIKELLNQDADVSLNIKASDLQEFFVKLKSEKQSQAYPENKPKLYTRAQVAELLNVSYPTLWRWVKNGRIERKKIGNRVYFTQAEVSRLVNPEK